MKKQLSTPVVVVILVIVVLAVGGIGWYLMNREPKPIIGQSSMAPTALPGQVPGGQNAQKPLQPTQ